MSLMGTAVHLERTISAPPHRVYRAWLDPELLRRWCAPTGFEATSAEVDERVGGRVSVVQAGPDGEEIGGAECVIVELVPDERIVLDWTFVGPDRTVEPDHATRLTVTLRAVEAGTHLTLDHDRLDGLSAAMPEVARAVEGGWDSALARLAGAVA